MRLPMHRGECCVSGEDREICLCRNSAAIDLIGRKWTLLTLWLLAKYGRLRYTDLERKLDGVNPSTLSTRLREMQEASILARERFSEIPPRVEYFLTDTGEELARLTKPLQSFEARQAEGR